MDQMQIVPPATSMAPDILKPPLARALKTVAFCLKLGTPEIGYFEGTMIASHRTCISGQANYHHLPMFKLYKFLWRHCQPWDGKVLHFPSAGPLQILQSDSPFW